MKIKDNMDRGYTGLIRSVTNFLEDEGFRMDNTQKLTVISWGEYLYKKMIDLEEDEDEG